mmetsp:Transcript_59663/g.177527  ORF Transcript_59663/g.177527 Transcript_59663/m.177527 type:complete len:301 (-) Transcript_59663:415-1317(-)
MQLAPVDGRPEQGGRHHCAEEADGWPDETRVAPSPLAELVEGTDAHGAENRGDDPEVERIRGNLALRVTLLLLRNPLDNRSESRGGGAIYTQQLRQQGQNMSNARGREEPWQEGNGHGKVGNRGVASHRGSLEDKRLNVLPGKRGHDAVEGDVVADGPGAPLEMLTHPDLAKVAGVLALEDHLEKPDHEEPLEHPSPCGKHPEGIQGVQSLGRLLQVERHNSLERLRHGVERPGKLHQAHHCQAEVREVVACPAEPHQARLQEGTNDDGSAHDGRHLGAYNGHLRPMERVPQGRHGHHGP